MPRCGIRSISSPASRAEKDDELAQFRREGYVLTEKHPDWQCTAKPTDPHAGTVVPRCGVQERREARPSQTQKLNSMSIPPALPKPRLLVREFAEARPDGAFDAIPSSTHNMRQNQQFQFQKP